MGKTTNALLAAGEEALRCRPSQVSRLPPLRSLRELHLATARDLGVDAACQEEVAELLTQLEQLLVGVSIMQDLTRRARDSLVSYGERLSVRLFAGYLRARGIPARAVDASDAGVETNDAFTNAEIDYERTLPLLRESLAIAPARSSSPSESSGEEEGVAGSAGETAAEASSPKALPGHPLPALSREESAATGREIPVVTGFLGRARQSGAVTTLGRGGSDLTCTLLGAALGLPEVQVWKDVDGVLTGDPRIVPGARPVGELTYEEATELAFFGATVLHPLAMQPAQEVGGMAVRVKNSYNRAAPGTRIAASRDLHDALVTSIVLKQNVTLVDIVSTKMLGTYGFLARVFGVFAEHKLSVDVVATSEVSVSLTLDPAKTLWERDLIEDELEALTAGFAGIARASYRRGMSILGIICNVQRTSTILERVFNVLGREGVNVQMMSQGASKTNISLIVSDAESERVLTCLHDEFFGPAKAA